MAEKDEIKWGLSQRFEFLEWRLFWVGRVNRSDLEDRFELSTPQASLDLRAYQDAQPGNIVYDATEKAYLPSASFEPRYLPLSADRYLLQLDAILNGAVAAVATWFGSPPPAAVMPDITISIEPKVLQAVLRAIRQRMELTITYQSLRSYQSRKISPHSLAFDGNRWHARAWCAEHREFRDFVLSRFRSVDGMSPSTCNPSHDMEWQMPVDIKITAHPDLDPMQQAAIEHDYGIENGTRTINTRVAFSFYLLRRLNLDLKPGAMTPERQQISLVNGREVELFQKAAKEETRRLIEAATVK